MAITCLKCGVPLEGFLYKWIANKIFKVEPSKENPNICNKCAEK